MNAMKKNSVLPVLFLLLLSGVMGYAQTAREVLARLNKTMATAASYDMQVEVATYTNEQDASPAMKYSGRAVRSGARFYTQMLDRITVVNTEYMLVLDKRQRVILYRAVTKDDIAQADPMAALNIDSLSTIAAKNAVFLKNTPQKKVLFFSSPEGQMKGMTMTIDAASSTIEEIVYTYEDSSTGKSRKAKAVIRYTNVKLNGKVDETLFRHQNYIVQKGKKITPAPAYKGYELMDQGQPVF